MLPAVKGASGAPKKRKGKKAKQSPRLSARTLGRKFKRAAMFVSAATSIARPVLSEWQKRCIDMDGVVQLCAWLCTQQDLTQGSSEGRRGDILPDPDNLFHQIAKVDPCPRKVMIFLTNRRTPGRDLPYFCDEFDLSDPFNPPMFPPLDGGNKPTDKWLKKASNWKCNQPKIGKVVKMMRHQGNTLHGVGLYERLRRLGRSRVYNEALCLALYRFMSGAEACLTWQGKLVSDFGIQRGKLHFSDNMPEILIVYRWEDATEESDYGMRSQPHIHTWMWIKLENGDRKSVV